MAKRQLRGYIARALPPQLPFVGAPQSQRERYMLSQHDWKAMHPTMVGLPIHSEHGTNHDPVGVITASRLTENNDWQIEFEIDADGPGAGPDALAFVDLDFERSLSLTSLHDNLRRIEVPPEALEVSLCQVPARDECIITHGIMPFEDKIKASALQKSFNERSVVRASASATHRAQRAIHSNSSLELVVGSLSADTPILIMASASAPVAPSLSLTDSSTAASHGAAAGAAAAAAVVAEYDRSRVAASAAGHPARDDRADRPRHRRGDDGHPAPRRGGGRGRRRANGSDDRTVYMKDFGRMERPPAVEDQRFAQMKRLGINPRGSGAPFRGPRGREHEEEDAEEDGAEGDDDADQGRDDDDDDDTERIDDRGREPPRARSKKGPTGREVSDKEFPSDRPSTKARPVKAAATQRLFYDADRRPMTRNDRGQFQPWTGPEPLPTPPVPAAAAAATTAVPPELESAARRTTKKKKKEKAPVQEASDDDDDDEEEEEEETTGEGEKAEQAKDAPPAAAGEKKPKRVNKKDAEIARMRVQLDAMSKLVDTHLKSPAVGGGGDDEGKKHRDNHLADVQAAWEKNERTGVTPPGTHGKIKAAIQGGLLDRVKERNRKAASTSSGGGDESSTVLAAMQVVESHRRRLKGTSGDSSDEDKGDSKRARGGRSAVAASMDRVQGSAVGNYYNVNGYVIGMRRLNMGGETVQASSGGPTDPYSTGYVPVKDRYVPQPYFSDGHSIPADTKIKSSEWGPMPALAYSKDTVRASRVAVSDRTLTGSSSSSSSSEGRAPLHAAPATSGHGLVFASASTGRGLLQTASGPCPPDSAFAEFILPETIALFRRYDGQPSREELVDPDVLDSYQYGDQASIKRNRQGTRRARD
jgi:hypothetical protein